MKWINNAPLCLVQRGRLDYELSGEQEVQQWGVRCTPPPLPPPPPFNTGRRQQEMLRRTYIKMSNKMPGGVTNALPSFPAHNRYAKISLIRTKGEDTVTQTHTRRWGRGTHCHTRRLKCHTGESGRMAGRGELSKSGREGSSPQISLVGSAGKRRQAGARPKVIDPVTQQVEHSGAWKTRRHAALL